MKNLNDIVREEIIRILNDDALFKRQDVPGVLPHFDTSGDADDMSSSCPICGTEHEGPCHNPRRKRDSPKLQIYGIVFDDE